MTTTYILHFEQPYHHARHYVGSADNLPLRISQHESGNGARLIEVIKAAGINFVLSRTFEGTRKLERRIKDRKETPKFCPICNPESWFKYNP